MGRRQGEVYNAPRPTEASPVDRPGATVLSQSADLVAAVVLVLLAAWAATWPASILRVLAAAPTLLLVPGYLLIQASVVPGPPGWNRLSHLAWALGLSLPLIGLAGLAAAFIPGGLRPIPVVLVLTVTCFALAAVAWMRRIVRFSDAPAPAPNVSVAPRRGETSARAGRTAARGPPNHNGAVRTSGATLAPGMRNGQTPLRPAVAMQVQAKPARAPETAVSRGSETRKP